jgi:hypothetical protein
MNLKYINIWLNPETGYDDDYRYEFTLHTRFICHYLSIKIRRLKIISDGSFNMISIEPNPQNINTCVIGGIDALRVFIPFNKKKYDDLKNDNCSYYLELFEEGFRKSSMFKKIPLESLLDILNEFKKGKFLNEWIYKKRKFKEIDLEITLKCEFTTEYFQLVFIANQISTKKELVKGIVIKTEPNELLFGKMFKDIIFDNDIVITDSSNSNRIIINKDSVLEGNLSFVIIGDDEMQNILSYKLNRN